MAVSYTHLDVYKRQAYIYGAICPAEGKGAGLVLPRCNTEGMTLHLAEIIPLITRRSSTRGTP